MPRNNPPLGRVDGDRCNRSMHLVWGQCDGVIMLHHSENCSCHISAPCSSCTAPRFYCPECGWEEADEVAEQDRLDRLNRRATRANESDSQRRQIQATGRAVSFTELDSGIEPITFDPPLDLNSIRAAQEMGNSANMWQTKTISKKDIEELDKPKFKGHVEYSKEFGFKTITYTD